MYHIKDKLGNITIQIALARILETITILYLFLVAVAAIGKIIGLVKGLTYMEILAHAAAAVALLSVSYQVSDRLENRDKCE